MSPATPPQLSTAVCAGGGSALSMPRMRSGTPAYLSRATRGARLSCFHRRARSTGIGDHGHECRRVSMKFRSTLTVLAILLGIFYPARVFAQATNPAYIAEMPSVERVMQAMQAGDADET